MLIIIIVAALLAYWGFTAFKATDPTRLPKILILTVLGAILGWAIASAVSPGYVPVNTEEKIDSYINYTVIDNRVYYTFRTSGPEQFQLNLKTVPVASTTIFSETWSSENSAKIIYTNYVPKNMFSHWFFTALKRPCPFAKIYLKSTNGLLRLW